jgi:hypothetical protein
MHMDDKAFTSTSHLTNNSKTVTYYFLTSVVKNNQSGETRGDYGVTVSRENKHLEDLDVHGKIFSGER